MPIKTSQNIAIAGAGLAGLLLSWRLLKEGHRVTLFEKNSVSQPRSAAHTAAAMISPMTEVVVSERIIYDLGVQSLLLWPDWIKDLNEGRKTAIDYQSKGSIVVAHAADNNELQQFYQDLNFHLGAENTAQWLDRSQIQTLEPGLSTQFDNGLLLPGEAYLDNRGLLTALIEEVRQLGGVIHEQSPLEFSPDPILNGEPLVGFDVVSDCRGVGAQDSNKTLNQPIRGVRGEVIWVQTDEIRLDRPVRLMHPRYKLYVVPKPNNCFIIGATEIESQDCSPVSVQSSLELCSALYTLNPAFAEARIVETDVNLRPSYLNNLPAVDWETSGSVPVLRINGLYRHGYLLAPALVEQALSFLK